MAFNPPQISSLYHNKQITSPIATGVLLIVIIVLFSWFILKPKMSAVSTQHATLKDFKRQLATVDEQKRQLNKLINDLASNTDNVKLTDEALPLSGRASKVHVLINNLARQSGLEVSQITTENMDEIISAGNKAVLKDPLGVTRELYTIPVTMSVSGNIDQFKNFLELVETNGRVMDISQLEILGEEGGTKYRVKIKTYSYEAL